MAKLPSLNSMCLLFAVKRGRCIMRRKCEGIWLIAPGTRSGHLDSLIFTHHDECIAFFPAAELQLVR